jgi:hypothetical protein
MVLFQGITSFRPAGQVEILSAVRAAGKEKRRPGVVS